MTNSEFVKAFAGSLWRPAIVPLPDLVWNLGESIILTIFTITIFGKHITSVFGEERASIITNGQRVACKRTLDLGYQFRYLERNSNLFKHFPIIFVSIPGTRPSLRPATSSPSCSTLTPTLGWTTAEDNIRSTCTRTWCGIRQKWTNEFDW